jgi:hypothetical protein
MKRNRAVLYSSLLAMVLSMGTACAKKPNDAQVTSDIQGKFSQDSGLSGKQLSVQTDGGVVTLSGNVDNAAQRDAAARYAASVSGVKTVVNNLQVGNLAQPAAAVDNTPPPAAPPKEEPKAEEKKASRPHKNRHSDADSGSNQMTADNQAPQAPPQQAIAPPADTAPPVQTPPPPPPPKKFIIDQGTQLTVRLVDGIDSEKNQTGDTFHATLNAPLTSDGETAIPSGVDISGHLVEVKSAGKFAGQSEVILQLDSITSGGKTYNVQTDQYKKTGSSRGKNTAEKVGGGALVGTLIGALAGGGKGAAIGAAAGAGVGGGVQAATKSQQIKLPSETVLNFTLQAPVTVIQANAPNANRPKLGDSQ